MATYPGRDFLSQFAEAMGPSINLALRIRQQKDQQEETRTKFLSELQAMSPDQAQPIIDMINADPKMKKWLKLPKGFKARAETAEEIASGEKAKVETNVAKAKQGLLDSPSQLSRYIGQGLDLPTALSLTAVASNPDYEKQLAERSAQVGPEYEKYKATQFFEGMMKETGGRYGKEIAALAPLVGKNDVKGIADFAARYPDKNKPPFVTVALQNALNDQARIAQSGADIAMREKTLRIGLMHDLSAQFPRLEYGDITRMTDALYRGVPQDQWPRDLREHYSAALQTNAKLQAVEAGRAAMDLDTKMQGQILDVVKSWVEQCKAAGKGKCEVDPTNQALLEELRKRSFAALGIKPPEPGTPMSAVVKTYAKVALSTLSDIPAAITTGDWGTAAAAMAKHSLEQAPGIGAPVSAADWYLRNNPETVKKVASGAEGIFSELSAQLPPVVKEEFDKLYGTGKKWVGSVTSKAEDIYSKATKMVGAKTRTEIPTTPETQAAVAPVVALYQKTLADPNVPEVVKQKWTTMMADLGAAGKKGDAAEVLRIIAELNKSGGAQ